MWVRVDVKASKAASALETRRLPRARDVLLVVGVLGIVLMSTGCERNVVTSGATGIAVADTSTVMTPRTPNGTKLVFCKHRAWDGSWWMSPM